MATHDTQNAQDGIDGLDQANAQSGQNANEGSTKWNFASNLIIIGAFASFAIALVGFLIGHYATLVLGATLLAIVAFVWAAAAAVVLYKALAGPFIGRLFSRREGQNE